MPARDGSGPLGGGSGTGRGLGPCVQNLGYGFGRGVGRGYGRGFSSGFTPGTPTEKQRLQAEREYLRKRLEDVERQLKQ